jgi:hypothetical protein
MLIAKKTNLTMAYSSSLSKTATFMFRAIIICVLMTMASSADAYPIPGNAGASIDQKNNASIINQILPPDLIPGNITVITNHVVVSLLGTVIEDHLRVQQTLKLSSCCVLGLGILCCKRYPHPSHVFCPYLVLLLHIIRFVKKIMFLFPVS